MQQAGLVCCMVQRHQACQAAEHMVHSWVHYASASHLTYQQHSIMAVS
jgi:hypothetical protein